MNGNLQPDGSSVQNGILSPVGEDVLFPLLPSQKAMLSELRMDALSLNETIENLNEIVRNESIADYADMSLHGQRINAEMRASAENELTQANGNLTKIDNQIKRMLTSEALSAAKNVGSAGIVDAFEPWEQMLYRSLPPAEAYRVAETLKEVPNATNYELSVAAAQIVDSTVLNPDGSYTFPINNPVIQPVIDPITITINNPVTVGGGANNATPPCPPNEAMQNAIGNEWGPSGWYLFNGVPVYMDDIPILDASPEIQRKITARQMMALRFDRCIRARFDLQSNEWVCVEQGPPRPACNQTVETPEEPTTIDPTSPNPFEPSTCPIEPGCPAVLPPGSVVIIPTQSPSGPIYPPYTSPPPPPPTGTPTTPVNVTVNVDTDDDEEPPPPSPPPPPPPNYDSPCSDFDHPQTVCLTLSSMKERVLAMGPAGDIGSTTSGELSLFEQLVGAWSISSAAGNLFSVGLQQGVQGLLKHFINEAVDAAKSKDASCDCDATTYVAFAGRLAIPGFAEQWLGMPLTGLFMDQTYAMQSCCPQTIPSQSELDTMYLSGLLDEESYICYTKMLGNSPNLRKMYAYNQRMKPGFTDLYRLNKLGYVNEAEYNERVKALGVMNDTDQFLLQKTQEYVPTPSELVTWMQKDVSVEEFVQAGNLDEGFDESFTNNADFVAWASANGIDETVMKYNYRSSWVFPSNTQIYSMLHRLRPGRVAPELVVTEDDAKQVLKINDIAPGFQDKILAISMAVPTRMDIKNGYFNGDLDEEQVKELIMDNGYSDENAQILTNLYKTDKEQRDANEAKRVSNWSPKMIARAFGNGYLSSDEAIEQLTLLKIDVDMIGPILSSGLSLTKANARKKCMTAVRRKYMLGIITQFEMLDELVAIGVYDEAARVIVEQYACERSATLKEASVSKNVKWFVDGIIDLGTLTLRLGNLNYTEQVMNNYLQEAIREKAEAQQKAIEAAMRRAEAAAEKERKRIERIRKEQERLAKLAAQQAADEAELAE